MESKSVGPKNVLVKETVHHKKHLPNSLAEGERKNVGAGGGGEKK